LAWAPSEGKSPRITFRRRTNVCYLKPMAKRRSLTPQTGTTADTGVHATRRGSGGARREATNRVFLRSEESEITGWSLNLSRGGIRVILEDKVELGQEFEIALEEPEAEASGSSRLGRVVWVQEEKDGMVVGLEFVDGDDDGGPPDAPPKNM
jgi:PilZ domain